MKNTALGFTKMLLLVISLLFVSLIASQAKSVANDDVAMPPSIYFDYVRSISTFF